MMLADPMFTWGHTVTFLAGSTAMGIIGNAVNTFPTPQNPYGQWLLGVVKYAVGQRISGLNAMRGQDTLVAAVPRGTGTGSGASAATTEVNKSSVDVTDETITVKDMKQKTTVIPNIGGGPSKGE